MKLIVLLLIAGAISPFVIQLVKIHIARTSGVPALLLTMIVDLILAVTAIWFAGAPFTLWDIAVAGCIVFAVAHTVYMVIIAKYFPNAGSV